MPPPPSFEFTLRLPGLTLGKLSTLAKSSSFHNHDVWFKKDASGRYSGVVVITARDREVAEDVFARVVVGIAKDFLAGKGLPLDEERRGFEFDEEFDEAQEQESEERMPTPPPQEEEDLRNSSSREKSRSDTPPASESRCDTPPGRYQSKKRARTIDLNDFEQVLLGAKTEHELKKAYKSFCKSLHPDRGGGSKEAFQKLELAFRSNSGRFTTKT